MDIYQCPPLAGKGKPPVYCKVKSIRACAYCPVREGGVQPEELRVAETIDNRQQFVNAKRA